jgi:hypothetical protein
VPSGGKHPPSPIQCISGATFLAVTQPEHKDDQSPPTSTGVENAATPLLAYMPSQHTEEHPPSLIETDIDFTAVLFPTCKCLTLCHHVSCASDRHLNLSHNKSTRDKFNNRLTLILPGAYLPDSRWYSWLRLSYEFLRTVRASNFSCMLCPSFSSCGFFDRFSSETIGRGIILCVHKLLIMKMYWGSGGVYLHVSLNLALELRERASSLGKAPCTETCTG